MFYIVETTQQFEDLKKEFSDKVYIDFMCTYTDEHYQTNELNTIYIRGLESSKGYIIPIEHYDGLCEISKEDIVEWLNTLKIYTPDKKKYLHRINTKDVVDLSWGMKLDDIKPERRFRRLVRDLNEIPITKLYERFTDRYTSLKPFFNDCMEDNNFYQQTMPTVFYNLEKVGIPIDPEIFSKHFYKTQNRRIHTNYNYHTTTTRPTNTFNKVNYTALKKDNGCRRSIVASNDFLVEMDIKAYHPTIVANFLEYSTGGIIYDDISNYFDITYKESKQAVMNNLYGDFNNAYYDHPFFVKVRHFRNELYNQYNRDGFIECPISKYRISKESMGELSSTKLFNYVVQNMETTVNVFIMKKIQNVLENCRTKLIMYTYDSFLFDYYIKDREQIKKVKKKFGDMNLVVTIKHGHDYDF